VFLNVVLLFLVLFYVYPLKFVFSLLMSEFTGAGVPVDVGEHQASVLLRIYAMGFACVFGLFMLMYAHAYRLRRTLALNEVESHATRASIAENAIFMAVGLVSFLIAFKDPGLAGWWYFVLAPALSVHGYIVGRRTRALDAGARAQAVPSEKANGVE
jgi:vacuolar-type H+-ATPase subunit I/STV1